MNHWRAKQIMKQRDQFVEWLVARGAQMLNPTNEWELVRFKAGEVTCIIYRNKVGIANFVGQAVQAWEAFKSSASWRAMPATKRKKSDPMITAIRARDGDDCFFCLLEVSQDDESAEHLVAITHQGPNHISNLFLAHRKCNVDVGHLSAPEKIRIHVDAQLRRIACAPPAEPFNPVIQISFKDEPCQEQ